MAQKTWNGGDSTNPNSWTDPDNWLEGVIPGSGDTVTIAAEGASILENVSQPALALNAFRVEEGFKGDIGTPGAPLKFKLAVDEFVYAGTGVAYIDVVPDGISDLSPLILRCGQGRTGVHGLSLAGDKYKKITFSGPGFLGVGMNPGDTQSRLDTLDVSGPGTVELGASIAKITSGSTDVTLSHPSASITVDCNVATLEAVAGTHRQRKGNWNTANVHEATAYASGSGSYTATNVDTEGAVFNDENNTARTFTDITIENGGTWQDPAATGTYTNPIQFPTGMDRCTLDFGRNRRLDVDDIP